jgi:hypothetical protein
MTPGQARTIEYTIVGISIASLVLIFQPFLLGLFTIGAAAVVVAGLAFNLVPLCQPGRPARSLVKATLVILVVFAIVTGLALASAELYSMYLQQG